MKESIQQRIAGKPAPHVTEEMIEERIDSVEYAVFGDRLTVCVVTLDNGFMVTGTSACAHPDNFDPELGEDIALENAKEQLWPLLGFALVEKLAEDDGRARENLLAKIAHEVNAAYCSAALGDHSQPPWSEAPLWQRHSALGGVQFHMQNPDAQASASHEIWLLQKEADGWVYGEVKDPQAKTHPCMVPFKQLPREQQVKDFLFKAVVEAGR